MCGCRCNSASMDTAESNSLLARLGSVWLFRTRHRPSLVFAVVPFCSTGAVQPIAQLGQPSAETTADMFKKDSRREVYLESPNGLFVILSQTESHSLHGRRAKCCPQLCEYSRSKAFRGGNREAAVVVRDQLRW